MLSAPPLLQHILEVGQIVDGRFCLGWCPNPSSGSHAWLQEMASSGFLYPIDHLHSFLNFHFTRFLAFPRNAPRFQVSLQYSLPPSHLIPSVPILVHLMTPHSTHDNYSVSPLQWDSCVLLFETFLLLSFSGPIGCSMVIYYFMANIHL